MENINFNENNKEIINKFIEFIKKKSKKHLKIRDLKDIILVLYKNKGLTDFNLVIYKEPKEKVKIKFCITPITYSNFIECEKDLKLYEYILFTGEFSESDINEEQLKIMYEFIDYILNYGVISFKEKFGEK